MRLVNRISLVQYVRKINNNVIYTSWVTNKSYEESNGVIADCLNKIENDQSELLFKENIYEFCEYLNGIAYTNNVGPQPIKFFDYRNSSFLVDQKVVFLPIFRRLESNYLLLRDIDENNRPKEYYYLDEESNLVPGPQNRFNRIGANHYIKYDWRESTIKAYGRIDNDLKWDLDLSVYYPSNYQSNNKYKIEVNWVFLDGNRIYIAIPAGMMFSIDINTGSIVWKNRLEFEIGAVNHSETNIYVSTPRAIQVYDKETSDLVAESDFMQFKKDFWKHTDFVVYRNFWAFSDYLIFYCKPIFLVLNRSDLSYFNSFSIEEGFLNVQENLLYHKGYLYIINQEQELLVFKF